VNSVEDRLRAATRAAANTMAPESAPPLRLPEDHPRRLGYRGWARRSGHRWTRLAIPLGAAAAVAALVISSVAVGQQQRPIVSHAAAAALAKVPPYFLTTGRAPRPQHAWIAATATGRAVAPVPVPAGDWVLYTAAAGGSTFVMVTAYHRPSGTLLPASVLRFFLIRFRPGHGTVSLTPVTGLASLLRAEPASYSTGVALSPDGSKLAVALGVFSPGQTVPSDGVPRIVVYDLDNGAARSWSWPVSGLRPRRGMSATQIMTPLQGGHALSWAWDNRTLAFQLRLSTDLQVRLLDTSAVGDDLQADSTLGMNSPGFDTWRHAGGRAWVPVGNDAVLTPDGHRIVMATMTTVAHAAGQSPRPVQLRIGFTEFSARTGQPLANLGAWRIHGGLGQVSDVLWSSPSGRTLIVLTRAPGAPISYFRSAGIIAGQIIAGAAHYRETIAVLSDGNLTPLRIPAGYLGQPFYNQVTGYPVWPAP
jgi:hypothetical protein